VRRLVFTPADAQPAGWFAFGQPDTLPVLPYPEYLAQSRQRPRPAAGRTAAQDMRYGTITGQAGKQMMTAAEIAAVGLPVVTAARCDELSEGPMRHAAFAAKVRAGVTVVELAGGRTAAALRRRLGGHLPVTTLNDRATAVAAAVAASLTEQDQEAERVHACAVRTPEYLIAALAPLRGQITNAAVAAVLDHPRPSGSEAALAQLLAGAREQQPGLFPAAEGHAGLAEQYPLLASIAHRVAGDARTRRHVVAYLNALAGPRGGQ
jgi:hypothetical protein